MQLSDENNLVEEEGFINQIFKRYSPFWPLFALLFAVCVLFGWIYLHYAVPIYESSASILVKDEKKGIDDANLMAQLDLFGSKKLVENEIEVIKSRILMHAVVKKFDLYAPLVQEGRIRSASAYQLSPVHVQIANPDSLVATKKIYFKFDSLRQVVTIGAKVYNLNTWYNDFPGKIRFILNPYYYQVSEDAAKPFYFSLLSVKKVADGLLSQLKVTQATKLSSVIDLKLNDEVPIRGEHILNGLINEYNRAGINDKNVLALNTLNFISERLKLVTLELDSLEIGIQNYKTDQGIVDLSAQGQLYLDNVGANDQKMSEAEVQLAVMDRIESYVKNNADSAQVLPSTFGVSNDDLSSILGKFYDLQVQYEGLRKTTAENNPLLITIKHEVDQLKPNILTMIRNQRENLIAGKNNLNRRNDSYNSVLRTLPKKEKGLVQISRQQEIKNTIYSFLLQKREETALSYNSAIADTRLIDNGESTIEPISPKKSVVYLSAIGFSFLLGISLISIKEVFNRNVMFRAEIEKYTSAPIIGEIIQSESVEALVINEGLRTFIAEQFRHIRTSLGYMGISGRKKRVMVTSTIGSEGKSFVSANLGVSLALADKKVVILEMDLRKPKVSKLFGVAREIGLTNYFIGAMDAEAIIKSTKAHPNLFVIPCGSIPPNPSELISNGRLDDLLSYLENIFDVIILDCPPVTPVTDSYIISPKCDTTLYVIRHGVAPKELIKKLDNNIKMRGLKNVGIIFNGVKNRGFSLYGASTYGYEYKNGYGYTSEEPKKQRKGKFV